MYLSPENSTPMIKLDFNNLKDHSSTELIEAAQRWLHNEYLPADQVKAMADRLN